MSMTGLFFSTTQEKIDFDFIVNSDSSESDSEDDEFLQEISSASSVRRVLMIIFWDVATRVREEVTGRRFVCAEGPIKQDQQGNHETARIPEVSLRKFDSMQQIDVCILPLALCMCAQRRKIATLGTISCAGRAGRHHIRGCHAPLVHVPLYGMKPAAPLLGCYDWRNCQCLLYLGSMQLQGDTEAGSEALNAGLS
jgi:hypothetical protein